MPFKPQQDFINWNPLKQSLQGQLLTDLFSRGRYATDASMYQIMPQAVAIPETLQDVEACLQFSRETEIPLLSRGGGTSQCGQTVNRGLVMDFSSHLNEFISLDLENMSCHVQPGLVLDELNRQLKPHGVWFPVDVSTASRATLGGMAANNSCGSRSLRYGLMRDNVLSMAATSIDGQRREYGGLQTQENATLEPWINSLLQIGQTYREEIDIQFPKVMRRVGGYNLDALVPANNQVNLSHILVGSEGTLATTTSLELKLSPLPRHKLLGVCHFPSFYDAMESTQHIVKLEPVAVELIDRTMIDLSRQIDIYKDTVNQFVKGEPEAILLVEFAEQDESENHRRLKSLGQLMADLGFSFKDPTKKFGGVVEALDPGFQSAIFEVRKSGLNIMMSMRDDRKPISFVEDCAVELEDLAEYTSRLTEIFHKHDTEGTWYAHASVGCLHVRPVLNLRQQKDVVAMRQIAEECFDMVKAYKGSHSGEHGDGICRSEFHEKMFGRKMVEGFEEIKQLFDPNNLMNPGKIVNPPRMDDATLFRYPPEYNVPEIKTALSWQGWTGQGGGFQGAVEMCNNNGACRKLQGGTMCPSYRVTRQEQHLTRGRANTLRLAISGQLGKQALVSDDMQSSMALCVSCKACKRECPTGIDMARMKIEVNAARYRAKGASLNEKLIAMLPRYAHQAKNVSGLLNAIDGSSFLKKLLEPVTGFSHRRKLPRWQKSNYKDDQIEVSSLKNPVVLFADTFNRYFEPENLHAARRVMSAAGYDVITPAALDGKRPLCCGRTFLTQGMEEEARKESIRTLMALEPYIQAGASIVGLEPSCLFHLKDELPLLINDQRSKRLQESAVIFEQWILEQQQNLNLSSVNKKVQLHGHCHQKAYDVMSDVESALLMVPGIEVNRIESGCCGMAGAFGYNKDTYEVSMAMAELNLLPAIRNADKEEIIAADGFSCRHQIQDGTGRQGLHVARILDMALSGAES